MSQRHLPLVRVSMDYTRGVAGVICLKQHHTPEPANQDQLIRIYTHTHTHHISGLTIS